MPEFPCPNCNKVFDNLDDLYNHVLIAHSVKTLTKTLEEQMSRPITRHDFIQVDSHWVYVVDGFHLSLAPDAEGAFKLVVYGAVGPIPSATKYPTEPEWAVAENLANKFIEAHQLASRRE